MKEVTWNLPKLVITLDVPDAATHQDIMDAFTADGFMAWAKTRVAGRLPPEATVLGWEWKISSHLGREVGEDGP